MLPGPGPARAAGEVIAAVTARSSAAHQRRPNWIMQAIIIAAPFERQSTTSDFKALSPTHHNVTGVFTCGARCRKISPMVAKPLFTIGARGKNLLPPESKVPNA